MSNPLPDGRWVFPAPERNRGPILEVLRRVLPRGGAMLEIASGTGQHVVHFARELPNAIWQPSDPDPRMRASISAWIAHEGLANVRPPYDLDVRAPHWPVGHADAVLCSNMIHIAPWAATEGLMAGAARVLGPGGALYLYGPYRRFGRHTALSNEAFDAELRAQNPEWGLRDLEAVEETAARRGFRLDGIVSMPANNFSVVFGRI